MGDYVKPLAVPELAELVEWLCATGDLIQPEHLAEHQRYKRAAELLQRLAAAAPQVAGEPTDDELIQLAMDTRLYRFQATAGDPVQYEISEQQVHAFARAVLARWGRPAPQAAGEPTRWQLLEYVEWFADENCLEESSGDIVDSCQEMIARWGRPALRPVPVSERMPAPEDCAVHPRTGLGNWCWGFERCLVSLAQPARWRLMHMELIELEASHWLPAHALPLPEVTE